MQFFFETKSLIYMMATVAFFLPYSQSLVSKTLRHSVRRGVSFASRSGSVMLSATESGEHKPGIAPPELNIDEQKLVETFRNHQSSAPKLPMAEEIKTLVESSIGYGVVSTNSAKYEGYPTGSIVGFSLDETGRPFFVMSTMSSHTTDIKKDSKASLTVTAKDFKGAADGRAVLIGDIISLPSEKINQYRENYLARHKDAFWITFGDFAYYIMDSIKTVRYVGGFARAGEVSGEDYLAAKPDPLYPIADRVMSHMNEDHEDALIAMVNHYVGVPASSAKMISMDRLGFTLQANLTIAGGSVNKVRIPFPREVAERKAVKEVLVEMTREASGVRK